MSIKPLTFTRFPSLPPELRLIIWNFTCRIPRRLELEYGAVPPNTGFPWYLPARNGAMVPSILHACRESREEGRKTYHRLCVGIWMNFAVDSLFYRVPFTICSVDEKEFLKLAYDDATIDELQSPPLWKDAWYQDALRWAEGTEVEFKSHLLHLLSANERIEHRYIKPFLKAWRWWPATPRSSSWHPGP